MMSRPASSESGLAAAGGGDVHQAGVEGREAHVVELEVSHRAGPQVLDHDVRVTDELAEKLLSLGRLEVDRYRSLVPIEPDERRRFAIQKGSRVARAVAADGVLDLDHVGAEVGQLHRAKGAGHVDPDLHNPDAGQRMVWLLDAHDRMTTRQC